ncbi:MAG TPA: hypothetical protein VGE67_11410 [Haloferula sp.]
MNANTTLTDVRVEFYDHSEQPLFDGYHSSGTAPLPSVGDTFQGGSLEPWEVNPTYVVERRHFQISAGLVIARIYGRNVQVTGGL